MGQSSRLEHVVPDKLYGTYSYLTNGWVAHEYGLDDIEVVFRPEPQKQEEMPSKKGYHWFRGRHAHGEIDGIGQIVYGPRGDGDPMFYLGGAIFPLGTIEGEWWGPLTPPWESGDE